ncbi:hypothetical protein QRD43_06115 [Pelomonas sp. APW6]|uniref:Uncharacterized protein n=1 Tax=Roseateles subflavus TaxID=3053353 RepID=A0ABT7LF52_9BURK|nr:hypothetical protein [Pelomonas sp. APW6]MDL5031478.1 hypothetical protein [Pelomonas sp. APW6]
MKSIKKRIALFALAAICGGAIAYPPPSYFCYKACAKAFLKGTPEYAECIAECDDIYP